MILGIGINDADYVVNKGGRGNHTVCHIYSAWHNMLKRCYNKGTQDKNPTYKGCSVCDEWLLFSNFKRWMDDNNYKGEHLDKDILKEGNKIYSPDTCYLVSNRINNLARSLLVVCGANLHKETGKYRAYFKGKHLGLFKVKVDALEACANHKIKLILSDEEIVNDKVLFGAFVILCDSYHNKIDEIKYA